MTCCCCYYLHLYFHFHFVCLTFNQSETESTSHKSADVSPKSDKPAKILSLVTLLNKNGALFAIYKFSNVISMSATKMTIIHYEMNKEEKQVP